ncbi:MAG: WD40 repeat domain-containing protein [Planctomycetes bacterium]|nr:WD40 repeat domain-containing protein [Planctomycetota bacterium]
MASHYSVRDELRCFAVLLMAARSVWLAPEAAHAGMLNPGNILISTGQPFQPRTLSEYTRAGQFVQSFTIPTPLSPLPTSEIPRDVVVTPDGLAHVYNGTFDPFLSTLNPMSLTWSHRDHPGWTTIANTTYGGIATIGQYIFATDNDTGSGDDRLMGVVRFDLVNGTSERFADTIEPIDLNMGLDGLLYVQYPGGSSSGRSVEVYDPVTLTHIRHVFFGLEDEHRSIAVSATGDFYLADPNGDIERWAPNATLISRVNVCGLAPTRCLLSDIDIAPDGTVIATSTRGRIFTTDLNLSPPQLFPTTFQDKPLFVTFVPEPGSAAFLGVVTIAVVSRPTRRRR